MADEWIKARVDLHEQPEVVGIARGLGIDVDAVVGKLLRFWRWADRVTETGDVPHVDTDFIDEITRHKSFAEAMIRVGWLERADGGICIPHFDRHNGKSAKHRARDAERKRSRPETFRDSSASEAEKKRTKHGLEKRREEKKEITPLPPVPGGVSSSSFDAFWRVYPRHVGKAAAVKAWAKLSPDDVLAARIIAAVRAQSATPAWTKDGGQFIPHPATWLNGRRWEDEVAAPVAAPPSPSGLTLTRVKLTPAEQAAKIRELTELDPEAAAAGPPPWMDPDTFEPLDVIESRLANAPAIAGVP